MSRFLLHPLIKGGSLTAVPPGQWQPVQNPSVLQDIELTESTDRARRGRISSIPSPWARLQLFRDAVVGIQPKHAFHDEALNDILDTLELVLFQEHLEGVKLRSRSISLDAVQRTAEANQKEGVVKFARALRDLAPEVDEESGTTLPELHVIVNGDAPNAPIVCATSPFTLFFTPETRRAVTPGYYLRNRPLRPLAQRPPALAWYVRDELLPQLTGPDNPYADLPEMQALVKLLLEQVKAVRLPDETLAAAGHSLRMAKVQPAPGVRLHHLAELPVESRLALRGTRTPSLHPRPPLVLDNSGSAEQRRYFPWLERPEATAVERDLPRTVLPNTNWRYDWVFPETDFLVEELLLLESPLFSDRVYAAKGDQRTRGPGQSEASKVLLPLTPKFFEYFRPEDVPNMLDMKVSASGNALRVEVHLTVPTVGGSVLVQRTYVGGERFNSHLSLWPKFALGAVPWRDYYLIHYLFGGTADGEIAVQIGTGAQGAAGVTTTPFPRDVNTVVYHFDRPPEFIHLRSRRFGSGAEGMILPRMAAVDRPTDPPWTVAIDFGTSNTVVAYRSEGAPASAAEPLTVSEATRFDLTNGEAGTGFTTFFDTFFFPAALEGRPFATVILKGKADVNAPEAAVPALTANIPFRGEVVGSDGGKKQSNEIVDNLKWGGGGADSRRLTRLFLHQVLQLVYAEALGRRVQTEGMQIRWSFPIAFSPAKYSTIAQQWTGNVNSFADSRGHKRITAEQISSLDESTASLRYFESGEPAAGKNFTKEARAIKLTCDVGGGTTDVTAYAKGKALFRTSMLFGGRDLIGLSDSSQQGGTQSIFGHLHRWAKANGLKQTADRVITRYPSDHTRFTYLVRLPWFEEHKGDLAGESWFTEMQACILYFYGAILYNIGLRLRAEPEGRGLPPDMIFFGGNGASYLSWLTQFNPWNTSPLLTKHYSAALQAALEAGYQRPLGVPLSIRTSSRPKMEVVLGLLVPADDSEVSDIDASAPVGEEVRFDGAARQSGEQLDFTDLRPNLGELTYAQPFDQWEISRYNRAFLDALPALSKANPNWRAVATKVRETFEACTELVYDNRVKGELAQLREDEIGAVSLFTVEAAITLRELEQRLFSE